MTLSQWHIIYGSTILEIVMLSRISKISRKKNCVQLCKYFQSKKSIVNFFLESNFEQGNRRKTWVGTLFGSELGNTLQGRACLTLAPLSVKLAAPLSVYYWLKLHILC